LPVILRDIFSQHRRGKLDLPQLKAPIYGTQIPKMLDFLLYVVVQPGSVGLSVKSLMCASHASQ
jgi:hypothetical protein